MSLDAVLHGVFAAHLNIKKMGKPQLLVEGVVDLDKREIPLVEPEAVLFSFLLLRHEIVQITYGSMRIKDADPVIVMVSGPSDVHSASRNVGRDFRWRPGIILGHDKFQIGRGRGGLTLLPETTESLCP